ncbi:MAG: hypothetical protein QOF49_1419 [Chloroflexota bacterium]|nr:hypothetical protein [Chloroflexota bacterium]
MPEGGAAAAMTPYSRCGGARAPLDRAEWRFTGDREHHRTQRRNGFEPEQLAELVETLADRNLVEVRDDADVQLTASGGALVDAED